jgi:hypothetical protein
MFTVLEKQNLGGVLQVSGTARRMRNYSGYFLTVVLRDIRRLGSGFSQVDSVFRAYPPSQGLQNWSSKQLSNSQISQSRAKLAS